MKRRNLGALMAALVITGGSLAAWQAGAVDTAATPSIAAAIADPGRPQADRDLDAARKPAETLAFVGLKPGERVVDVFAGPYFDRLFADVVGPGGKVYMFIPAEVVKMKEAPALANGSTPFPDHPNVVALTAPINAFSVPEAVDLVWIRQNYHDLHDKFMGPADVPAFNAAVFKALKPGGQYIVVDHSAPDGSGLTDTDTTHRIDAAQVKKEVTAAGFVFEGESNILRNPADPRTALVFDKAIRGHTDQFIYKFRKPA
ncbi:MAG: methyltransferase [Pseudomonadota bacterium]|nr:methyltransferase [Pseudomonadota bacterium]